MKKKINEGLEMDMTTYKKVKGTLDPKTPIKITDDKPQTSTSSYAPSSMTEEAPEGTIEPQDKATIKYLSNVKGDDGSVSKPFTIGGKNYQMVRGISPSKEVVMAVYCHDDVDAGGENIIHDMQYFEENIAKPAKMQEDLAVREEPKPIEKAKVEEPKTDKSLKLGEFKHFIIHNKTGKVKKFKRVEELAKAEMSDDETYMNLAQFKKHVDETLFGAKQKKNEISEDDGIKNRPDVEMAIKQMINKVKPYMDRINEPIEKIQLIVTLVKMLQLDESKYPMLMSALKKASATTSFGGETSDTSQVTQTSQTSIGESKIITKNELVESLGERKSNKVIKVKDLK